mgnify:CR=1 FL=1
MRWTTTWGWTRLHPERLCGREGAELAFESYLHGTPGERAVERNEDGKITSSVWLTDEETGEAKVPEPGDNVFLTIDIELQQMVEELLAERVPGLSDEVEGAACTVQLVDTGEILAAPPIRHLIWIPMWRTMQKTALIL